MKGDDLTHFEW